MTESSGSTLKQKREARHLSIEQVAGQTRIRAHYLQALENDDLSAIPSMVQARGFLRIYSEFLGLTLDELSSAARSTETQLPAPPAASTAEPAAAPAQSNVSASDSQPRSTFFGGLRDRFARRLSVEAATLEPEPYSPSESESDPEVFVPVRTHEELPSALEESGQPGPMKLNPVIKPARVRKASSEKTSTKKPERTKAEKTKSPKTGAGRKARVKKKITKLPSKKISSLKKKISLKNQSRPRRVCLPRKLSSSRPYRRLMKPNRKPAEPSPRTKSRKTKRPFLKKRRQ
jgi:transcriptional regulator with XRE-family HTH domain